MGLGLSTFYFPHYPRPEYYTPIPQESPKIRPPHHPMRLRSQAHPMKLRSSAH